MAGTAQEAGAVARGVAAIRRVAAVARGRAGWGGTEGWRVAWGEGAWGTLGAGKVAVGAAVGEAGMTAGVPALVEVAVGRRGTRTRRREVVAGHRGWVPLKRCQLSHTKWEAAGPVT